MPMSVSRTSSAKLRGASKQFVLERERIVAFISGVGVMDLADLCRFVEHRDHFSNPQKPRRR